MPPGPSAPQEPEIRPVVVHTTVAPTMQVREPRRRRRGSRIELGPVQPQSPGPVIGWGYHVCQKLVLTDSLGEPRINEVWRRGVCVSVCLSW